MLADLLPLMNDIVRQRHAELRDVFGKELSSTATDHRARVTYSPGKKLGPASGDATADAAAIVWLIDHPHSIAIGGTFELPDGDVLTVARLERRSFPDGVFYKVYLT